MRLAVFCLALGLLAAIYVHEHEVAGCICVEPE